MASATDTFFPTAATGATEQPHELVYVAIEHHARPDEHQDLLGPGINGSFVVDVLSTMAAHERCGRHLYRSVAGRTVNPMLARRYRAFGDDTAEHVRILERTLAALDANPHYVSPTARAVEAMDTKLLESTFLAVGPLDVMQREMAMLDAVIVAETIDHANWSTLADLVVDLPEGPARAALREAVATVEGQEDEHLTWAEETKRQLVLLQARNPRMAAVGAKAEELLATVQGWFSDDASAG